MNPQLRISDVPHRFAEGTEDQAPPKTRAQIRSECFAERWPATARRAASALLDIASRQGPAVPLSLAGATLRSWLAGRPALPRAQDRTPDADGFCGIARDLSASTIMGASARGLLAAAPLGPAGWWSPAERWIAEPALISVAAPDGAPAGHDRALVLDQDFERVLVKCAAAQQQPNGLHTARERGLSPALMHAFAELFDAGVAHCFAIRDRSGALLGGGFGLAVGRVFITQGRFGRAPGVATTAFALFNAQLAERGFAISEAPPASDLADVGFRPVARREYERMLAVHLGGGRSGRWDGSSSAPAQAPYAMQHAEA